MRPPICNPEPLIEMIYAAADDPAYWQCFLERFAIAMEAGLSLFSLVYRHTPEWSISCFTGATAEDHQLFLERWADQDPWIRWLQHHDYDLAEVRRSNEMCSDDELEATRIYQEFLAPRNWHYGCGVLLARDKEHECILTLSRPKAKGPCTDQELDFVRWLVPHLQRAVRIHSRVKRLETERQAFLAHIDQMHNGFFLVAETGLILLSNEAARGIVASRDGLVIRDNHLSAVAAGDRVTLRASIQRAVWGLEHDPEARTGFPVSRGFGDVPYWVLVWPVHSESGPLVGSSRPAATILVINPARQPKLEPERVARLLELTPAEARLGCRLAGGEDLREVAESLGVSIHTVRTHLKRIFSKTGTGRQAELIALILRVGEGPAGHAPEA